MLWREAVWSSLLSFSHRHATRIVERQELIKEEMDWIISSTQSQGATPSQTLSRVLQELRNDGEIEFLGDGVYFLLNAPINVEAENLSDEAIDFALLANQLRIGIVPTDTQQAQIRQRRGQDRVRALTLKNYGGSCAVCEISEPAMLIASHIVGWAEGPEYRGDLSNVMCLCRIHDSLFEAGYWSMDDNLEILKKPKVSKTIALILNAMTIFRLPHKFKPAKRFTSHHRSKSGFDS